MTSFPIDQQQIFEKTNGGFDIIRRFIPEANEKKHFKIRKEGTASANIYRSPEGIYFVKDWGDSGGFYSKSRHAIHIYSKETGRSYFESLLDLGEELGLIDPNKSSEKNLSWCKFHDYKGEELNEDGFAYKIKEFSQYELDTLGPLVTSEVCKKYGLYALESISWLKEEELKQKEFCDVGTLRSSDTYPIFAFIVTEGARKPKIELKGKDKKVEVEPALPGREWLKLYQPKAKDKGFRFRYFGKKPAQHIFGLDILKNMTVKKEDVKDDESGVIIGEKEVVHKVQKVIICSGDRDSINMASTGKADAVVWFNSETADITESQINLLFKYAHNVINIPDLDPTGVDAGKKIALEHLEVKTAWLPEEIGIRRDFRGNPFKDFTDFMKMNASYDDKEQRELKIKVERFLEQGRPAKFWTQSWNERSKKYEYRIHYKNAFHFLKLNGFFRIKDDSRKDGFYFVKQDKHVLKEVSAQEIKDFFNVFLDEGQKKKGLETFPDELLNMLIGSEAVSDKKLVNLETKVFDFTDYTDSSQYFFFDKFIWHVTKDGVEEINKGYSRYVKEDDIINNIVGRVHEGVELDSEKITILPGLLHKKDKGYVEGEKLFDIKKTPEGIFEVKILREDCEFMNYMINGSRVFWEKEMEHLSDDEQIEYKKNNPSNLNSDKLTEDENYTQDMHFINKAFSYGYTLHRYKTMAKAWGILCMDDKIVEDNASHGRTGKSLAWNAGIRCFMRSEYKGARRKEILDGGFLYDGVTAETDYLLFDDANNYFRYNELFTDITGEMTVNRKNLSAFNLSFYRSPKIAITTNFSLKNLDPSLHSRLLINSWSNFYHGYNAAEGVREFSPRDHFGVDFFSRHWNEKQWNLFINFCMQCLIFYLNTAEKIEAPMESIRKRNLLADIGPIFKEFMDKFLLKEENFNTYLSRDDLHKLVQNEKQLVNWTNAHFKTQLGKYCELNGYILNPQELWNDKKGKRITKWTPEKKVTEEKLYIRKEDAPENTEQLTLSIYDEE